MKRITLIPVVTLLSQAICLSATAANDDDINLGDVEVIPLMEGAPETNNQVIVSPTTKVVENLTSSNTVSIENTSILAGNKASATKQIQGNDPIAYGSEDVFEYSDQILGGDEITYGPAEVESKDKPEKSDITDQRSDDYEDAINHDTEKEFVIVPAFNAETIENYFGVETDAWISDSVINTWMGELYVEKWPWIYHENFGWFTCESDSAANGAWFYSGEKGWFWTSPNSNVNGHWYFDPSEQVWAN